MRTFICIDFPLEIEKKIITQKNILVELKKQSKLIESDSTELELKIKENHLGSKLSFPLISFVLDKNFSREKIAYAFQNSVVEILVKKSLLACQKKQVKTLLVGGGVAANSLLRKKLQAQSQARGIQVFYPPVSFCIDNAAMIAGLAYHTVKKNRRINRSSKERRKLCTTLN